MTPEETQHLNWIYNRLIHVHHENEHYDYMLAFKRIIDKTQEESIETIFNNADKYATKMDAKDKEENNIQESGYWFWYKLFLKETFKNI